MKKRCTTCNKIIDHRSVTGLCAVHYGNTNNWSVPDDFAERAKTTRMTDMARLYGVSVSTISRICREKGVVPIGLSKASVDKILAAYAEKTKPKPKVQENVRPHIHAEAAARELQKRGEVVKVSDRTGKRLSQRGPFYRVWGKVMEPSEVVELAITRHKFDPDAWKRIGA